MKLLSNQLDFALYRSTARSKHRARGVLEQSDRCVSHLAPFKFQVGVRFNVGLVVSVARAWCQIYLQQLGQHQTSMGNIYLPSPKYSLKLGSQPTYGVNKGYKAMHLSKLRNTAIYFGTPFTGIKPTILQCPCFGHISVVD